MTLPVEPPVHPMLAKLTASIPEGPGWRYEPKWDGFRALVWRDGDEVILRSRDDRPLERYFPELLEVTGATRADRWVADAEILVVRPEGLAFDALLQRIHPAESRVRRLAAEWPASLILFDLLARDDRDLRASPDDDRRTELEGLAPELDAPLPPDELALLRPGPAILVTPRTTDPALAARWFADEEGMGQDGVIARRGDQPYREGERAMVKVKHRRSVDCVVGGYRLAKVGDGVGSLLLGLYGSDGTLHYVGHTSSFKAAERRSLREQLAAYEGDGGFGQGRTPGGQSRWTGGRETAWVPLRPELVCEVSVDRMQGERFRHAATFERWRFDRDPRSCTFEQLLPGRPG
jgi:ATP-dependent DNA ligase